MDDFSDIMSPFDAHNRTLRASIDTVNTKDGYATISLGFPSSGRYASLPWLWVSFPGNPQDAAVKASTIRGAWGRYMPFKNDTIKVAFDYDDTPHIVGYDLIGGTQTTYGHDAYTAGVTNNVVHPNFVELSPGEYDFMSIGGAYIYGQKNGDLLLSSNNTQLLMSTETDDINMSSGVTRIRQSISGITFGQVRRESAPLSGQYETIGPWNPTGLGKEFEVLLQNTTTGIDRQKVARFAIGNLADSLSIELVEQTSLPKMLAAEIYDVSGVLKVWSTNVDSSGSTLIESPTATTFLHSTPLAAVSLKRASVTDATTGQYKISSLSYNLSTNAAISLSAGSSISLSAGSSISLAATETFGASGSTVSLLSTSSNISIAAATSLLTTSVNTIISAVSNITLSSSSITLAAPSISIGGPTPDFPSGGPVALGPSPTGGVLNGAVLSSILAAASPNLISALAAASALSSVSTPISGSAVAPILLEILAYLQTLDVGVPTATSSTVTV